MSQYEGVRRHHQVIQRWIVSSCARACWGYVDVGNDQVWFQRLPPARGGTAQKKIIHLANWSQLIHPGPASSLTKFFFVSSKSCVNADSLLIRAAATSTSGTLNDLTTDLIMANNNNKSVFPSLAVIVNSSK